MKISIVADSFGAFTDPTITWPYFLQQELNASVNTYGDSGCSNWHIFQKFKKYYQPDINYFIIILTSQVRIPCVLTNEGKDMGLAGKGLGNHPNKNMNLPDGLIEFGKGYLKFFYNDEFAFWLCHKIIDDISDMLIPGQKIIWLNALAHNTIYDYIKYNSTSLPVQGRLIEYSEREITDRGLDWLEYNTKNLGDPRKNHFSIVNQKKLALFLSNIINKDQSSTLKKEYLNLEFVDWSRNPVELSDATSK